MFRENKNNKRNYIFVNDAAKFIISCINKKKFGIFYLGGETQTFKIMIEKINSIIGSKKKIIFKKNKDLKSDQIIMKDKSFKTTSFSNSLKIIKCE